MRGLLVTARPTSSQALPPSFAVIITSTSSQAVCILSLHLRYAAAWGYAYTGLRSRWVWLTWYLDQEYQKGAIYRQMLEYKRQAMSLENRVQELEKKSTDHDDHIRIMDAWVLQVRWVRPVRNRLRPLTMRA